MLDATRFEHTTKYLDKQQGIKLTDFCQMRFDLFFFLLWQCQTKNPYTVKYGPAQVVDIVLHSGLDYEI